MSGAYVLLSDGTEIPVPEVTLTGEIPQSASAMYVLLPDGTEVPIPEVTVVVDGIVLPHTHTISEIVNLQEDLDAHLRFMQVPAGDPLPPSVNENMLVVRRP